MENVGIDPKDFDEYMKFYLIDYSTLKDIEELICKGWTLEQVEYDKNREYKLSIILINDGNKETRYQ